MVRAMELRSDHSGFCALQPCFKTAIMPFLLPLFLPSHIQPHAVVLLVTSCWEPLAQEDQFYQYQKVILHNTDNSGCFSKAVPAHDCQLSKGLPFYLTDLAVVSCFEG